MAKHFLHTIIALHLFGMAANLSYAAQSDWRQSSECNSLLDYLGVNQSSVGIEDTDGFIVLKNGSPIYQKFAPGFKASTPHRMWSASKLMANLLVARAVGEGRLSLDQRLNEFFPAPEFQNNPESRRAYEKITIRDLLMMRSGFEWQELETTDMEKLNVMKMIYGKESKDVVTYALSQPVNKNSVGKVFNYSTADYNILSGILKKVYRDNYEKLPWKLLFDPMGMKNVVVERDTAKTYLLGSNVYMSAQDLAKVGVMLSQKGKWNDNQFLPKGWVDFMLKPNSGQMVPEFSVERLKSVGVMGSPFWLNFKARGLPNDWPSFPSDTYMSFGFMGQNLAVMPSRGLVYVRFGQDLRYGSKVKGLGEKLFPCLAKGGY